MAIALRKKILSSGKISLYLDIYTGEERIYEFLKLYLYKRPKDDLEKQHNKEVMQTAENIRAKRELQVGAAENGVAPAFKTKTNFLAFFEKFNRGYTKADSPSFTSALRYLTEFSGADYLSLKAVTESFCHDFKDFLDAHKNLNGETSYNYFSRFKKVLRQAVRDKLISSNPAGDVVNKRNDRNLSKEVLMVDELQALAKARCSNTEVKRAFLFACNTGLRRCDIRTLKWKHIQQNVLRKQQGKTEIYVIVNLNKTAMRLLGQPGQPEENIFNLPSDTAITNNLYHWKERAGITKKVTFHVGRHSFATNLLIHDTDLKSVSALLGHTTVNHTQKYTRVVEALKQQAVNRLPEIEL